MFPTLTQLVSAFVSSPAGNQFFVAANAAYIENEQSAAQYLKELALQAVDAGFWPVSLREQKSMDHGTTTLEDIDWLAVFMAGMAATWNQEDNITTVTFAQVQNLVNPPVEGSELDLSFLD